MDAADHEALRAHQVGSEILLLQHVGSNGVVTDNLGRIASIVIIDKVPMGSPSRIGNVVLELEVPEALRDFFVEDIEHEHNDDVDQQHHCLTQDQIGE